jgi:hypothetical protein
MWSTRQNQAVGVVHLWEVASGTKRCTFEGHRGLVRTLSFSPDGALLASGSSDTTILLWDLTGRTWTGLPAKAHLPKKELAGLWTELAKWDAKKAFPAQVKLAAAPLDTVAFLHKELRPEPKLALGATGISERIADLNDAHYKVRRKAARELEQLGLNAKPALLKALKSNLSVEMRRRVEQLLARAETARLLVDLPLLRSLRALEVLERIASLEARKVLQALSKGNPQARLTQEAKAVLGRLASQTPAKERPRRKVGQ